MRTPGIFRHRPEKIPGCVDAIAAACRNRQENALNALARAVLKQPAGTAMRNAIAIGMFGLAMISNGAAAQTAPEQDAILRDFQLRVADYTHDGLAMFPWAVRAAKPAPKIFTLPVSMVFRQIIARAIARGEGGAAISGTATGHHPTVLQPFPSSELTDFPRVLSEALPLLPAPLEYRLIGNDLVIRDASGDVIVAVLAEALGGTVTRQ